MNVSFLNEKKFLLQNKMDEIKEKIDEKKSMSPLHESLIACTFELINRSTIS